MEQKYVSFLPGSSTTPQSEHKPEIGTNGMVYNSNQDLNNNYLICQCNDGLATPCILDESTPMLENGAHLEPMPVRSLPQPPIAEEQSTFSSAFGLPKSMMPKSREKRRSSSRSLYHYHKVSLPLTISNIDYSRIRIMVPRRDQLKIEPITRLNHYQK